jgi:hypothetical protein
VLGKSIFQARIAPQSINATPVIENTQVLSGTLPGDLIGV